MLMPSRRASRRKSGAFLYLQEPVFTEGEGTRKLGPNEAMVIHDAGFAPRPRGGRRFAFRPSAQPLPSNSNGATGASQLPELFTHTGRLSLWGGSTYCRALARGSEVKKVRKIISEGVGQNQRKATTCQTRNGRKTGFLRAPRTLPSGPGYRDWG